MHPYKRRCVQAVAAGQNEPPPQQPSTNPYLNSQVVDLTGPSYYDAPFYGHQRSTGPAFPSPMYGADQGEDASLQLARQLQAQEDALNYSAQQGQRHGIGSSSQAMPYVQDDEVLARQLQAQFEAENVQPDASLASSAWPHQQDSLAGLSSTAPTFLEEDERLAYQLDADFQAQNVELSVPTEAEMGPSALQSRVSTAAAALESFAQRTTATTCAGCQRKHFSVELDVVRLFKKWLNGEAQPRSCLGCSRCSAVTCLGCGVRTPRKKTMPGTTVKGIKLDWCCDQGRLFLTWVLLCGFDHQLSCEARRNNYVRQNYARPPNAQGGIGYGGARSNYASGMGYPGSVPPYVSGPPGYGAGQAGGTAQAPMQHHSQAEAAGSRIDGLTERVLVFLSVLLPTFEGESDFDLNPPPEILSMLLDSAILDKAAELLRNDSLEDATRRSGLYDSVLDFVRALGSHHATAEAAVHCERAVKSEGVDLLKLSFGTAARPKGKGKDEKTQSVASCLRNLNTQSNMMLQTAKKNMEDFRGSDGQQMLKLCRRISELADFLLANSRPIDSGELDADKTTPWERWQKEICLLELEDAQILAGHHYAQEAGGMPRPPPGRMKRLMLDITSLKTGLPAGIFVRHGSSRLDVMKFLIVGPVGSPYEGGLFEFDLLCPSNYPSSPPRVHFRTTGGGQARFNPNLYNDGKVCLSLLGTWSGEPWKPGESTILQVLLSIQAMIFCDDPWCNEPGREGQSGTSMSKDYNKTIQAMTVRYAMLGWLQANQASIWQDVIVEHFKSNGATILNKVNEWAQDARAARPSGYSCSYGFRAISSDELSQLRTHISRVTYG